MPRMQAVSVVILTMGDRPGALAEAVGSARAQAGVEVEVVLVVNGGNPDRTIADVIVEPGENLGIPGGRNAGAAAAGGELVCFLDDDGVLVGHQLLADTAASFERDASLAVIGLRVVDEDGRTSRRHLPGLRKDPGRTRDATSFPGGACIIRRAPFDSVGGFCGELRYGLEETDLAWRLIDRGWTVRYRADLRMRHPRTKPTRHPDFHLRTARNRVWLAHRSLPVPIGATYVAAWTIVTVARNLRRPRAIGAHLRGTRTGWRSRVGPRTPIAWATVIRLSRLGRPPVF